MIYYEGIICSICFQEVCQTCDSCHNEHDISMNDFFEEIEKSGKKIIFKLEE